MRECERRPIMTAYAIVPVDIYDDGTTEINLDDSGEPGSWGNVYVYEYDGDDIDGEWDFDHDAVAQAYSHVRKSLTAGIALNRKEGVANEQA